ncbi:MAG: hypothetical protein GY853_14435 [PVC group bacterium]|nr:hypothetical protein [PVC group bacterium]
MNTYQANWTDQEIIDQILVNKYAGTTTYTIVAKYTLTPVQIKDIASEFLIHKATNCENLRSDTR